MEFDPGTGPVLTDPLEGVVTYLPEGVSKGSPPGYSSTSQYATSSEEQLQAINQALGVTSTNPDDFAFKPLTPEQREQVKEKIKFPQGFCYVHKTRLIGLMPAYIIIKNPIN